MAIVNKPTVVDNPLVNAVRSQAEQRAEWFYLMNNEAEKKGHKDWEEWCRPAIFRCGCFRGDEMLESFKDKGDLLELAENYKNSPTDKVFEKEYVKCTEDELIMHFHYCPLLAGWQKMTDDEELIAKCCDIAMEGDRGIFSRIPDAEFILDGTLAEGKPYCRLIIRKTNKK